MCQDICLLLKSSAPWLMYASLSPDKHGFEVLLSSHTCPISPYFSLPSAHLYNHSSIVSIRLLFISHGLQIRVVVTRHVPSRRLPPRTISVKMCTQRLDLLWCPYLPPTFLSTQMPSKQRSRCLVVKIRRRHRIRANAGSSRRSSMRSFAKGRTNR